MSNKKIFCSNCGGSNTENAIFCCNCGKGMSVESNDVTSCTKCGTQLSNGEKFCQNCGKKVYSAEAKDQNGIIPPEIREKYEIIIKKLTCNDCDYTGEMGVSNENIPGWGYRTMIGVKNIPWWWRIQLWFIKFIVTVLPIILFIILEKATILITGDISAIQLTVELWRINYHSTFIFAGLVLFVIVDNGLDFFIKSTTILTAECPNCNKHIKINAQSADHTPAQPS
jgi:hypothetical protein